MTYQLFIGSNNNTQKLEIAKLRRILNECHDGCTIVRSEGWWKKQHEQSAVVTISDKDEKVLQTVYRLKEELNQQAIGVQPMPEMLFL